MLKNLHSMSYEGLNDQRNHSKGFTPERLLIIEEQQNWSLILVEVRGF